MVPFLLLGTTTRRASMLMDSPRRMSNAPAAVPGERPHRMLTVCGGTNIGSEREENQDTFVIADLESGRMSRPCIRTELWVSRPGVLMLVCDGMGGRPAGEVAAQLAAAFINHELQVERDNVGQAPAQSLNRAVLGANKAILDEAKAHPEERGMGTTCTAAIVSPERLAIVQVGDSPGLPAQGRAPPRVDARPDTGVRSRRRGRLEDG